MFVSKQTWHFKITKTLEWLGANSLICLLFDLHFSESRIQGGCFETCLYFLSRLHVETVTYLCHLLFSLSVYCFSHRVPIMERECGKFSTFKGPCYWCEMLIVIFANQPNIHQILIIGISSRKIISDHL